MAFKPATLIGPDGKRIGVKTEDEAKRLFASGYKLETSSPQAQSTPSDGVASFATSPLENIRSNVTFKDIIKNAIQKKQGMNRDIQEAKTYWRTKATDFSALSNEDKDYSLMSPEQQASVRAARFAVS